jgi:8-amino-7-oxononanoate synthase
MRDVLAQELDELRARGLMRSLKEVSSPQGREIKINGKTLLNFCSNDYLGLASDERLVVAAREAMRRSGFGSGASRLVCGNFIEHQLLERDIAQMKKTEAALVFSSGYMANAGIISALVGRDDAVFSDRLNHASIVDGIVLSRAELRRYPHNDVSALKEMLVSAAGYRRRLIVTDTVFSMDGDVAPLKEIAVLARAYDAWLMVDEAHAFGVLGPGGCGLVEELGLEREVDIQMGTLSKAAGSSGAYVAGARALIEYLLNSARSFIYTTGMPPAVAAASRAALRIIQDEPERRLRVITSADTLRHGLKGLGFDTPGGRTPIIPVMLGEAATAVAFSQKLMDLGVFVQAIRPPTVPEHTARLRVTVSAAHTEKDIGCCLGAFKKAREQC